MIYNAIFLPACSASIPGLLPTRSPYASLLVSRAAILATSLVAALVLISGCAFNRQYATTSSSNPTNGVATVTVARSTTCVFLRGKLSAAELDATASPEQCTVSADKLNQSSK